MDTGEPPTGEPPADGRPRWWAAAGLTALSCAMVTLMWPMFGDLWWLSPVAFVPMYLAQYHFISPRWSFVPVAAVFASYGFALAMLGASVAGPEIVIGGVLGTAVLGAAVGAWQRGFSERTDYRWFVLQLPVVWLFLEVAIQNNEIIGTYPWLAYRLADVPTLAAPVSITGTPALSFLIMVINALIALVLIRWLDAKQGPSRPGVPQAVVTRWVAGVVVVLLVWVVAGLGITAHVSNAQGPITNAAYVQPGLGDTASGVLVGDQARDNRTPDQRRDDQQADLSALTVGAAQAGAQLVVWPEEVLDYDPRQTRTEWIPDLARQSGVYLVAGFTEDFADPSQPNRALLWDPDGQLLGEYSKTKRVLMEGESFTPGTNYPAFPTDIGTLGMVICFDLDFPSGPVRQVARAGARIVAAPSIDFASAADVRTASTVFRAIENRVGIVKADLAWDSAVVGADGAVLAGTIITDDSGGTAVEVVGLPQGPGGAPFTAYGMAPLTWVSIGAFAALLLGAIGARRADGKGQRVHSARIGEGSAGTQSLHG